MSHYTVLETKLKDVDALAEALEDMGHDDIEIYEKPQPLVDFMGDMPNQKAEVIIRRKQVGWLSNDIGFRRGPGGTFDAIVSDFDQSRYDAQWMRNLTKRYAYHVARTKLEAQGFSLAREERDEQGRIHLLLRRTG
jgi:hypothetical protein